MFWSDNRERNQQSLANLRSGPILAALKYSLYTLASTLFTKKNKDRASYQIKSSLPATFSFGKNFFSITDESRQYVWTRTNQGESVSRHSNNSREILTSCFRLFHQIVPLSFNVRNFTKLMPVSTVSYTSYLVFISVMFWMKSCFSKAPFWEIRRRYYELYTRLLTAGLKRNLHIMVLLQIHFLRCLHVIL